MKTVTTLFITLILLFNLSGCTPESKIDSDIPTDSSNHTNSGEKQELFFLDREIKDAIVSRHKGKYLPGECYGVGYKVIETFEEDDIISVYALVEYVEYAFQDGLFVNISGTNPNVLMKFAKKDDGTYDPVYFTRLDIFSGLSDEELEELMLPLKESGKDYFFSERDLREVRAQCDKCALRYLESIGRNAQIGRRSEHRGITLSDIINDRDFVDELLKDEELNDYPDWLGTTERVVNGVRYIFKTEYDEPDNMIIYTEYEYDSGEEIKVIKVDIRQKKRIE